MHYIGYQLGLLDGIGDPSSHPMTKSGSVHIPSPRVVCPAQTAELIDVCQ